MRIDLHVYDDSTHDARVIKMLEKIMATVSELNDKIDGLTTDVADLGTAIDAFIASDAANFAALTAALAAGNPAAIDAAVAKIDAARATLAAKKDAVTAADAADNLPPSA